MHTLNQFLTEGFYFTGPGYIFKNSARVFHFNQPFLGTVARVSKLFGKLPVEFLDTDFEFQGLNFKQRIACARIVSEMATNSRRTWPFSNLWLTLYFLYRIEPEQLVRLAGILYHLCNFPAIHEAVSLLKVTK